MVFRVLYALCIAYFVGAFFMLVRSQWVYSNRMRLLRESGGLNLYNQLPPYKEMVWRFWIWDVRKFLKPTP